VRLSGVTFVKSFARWQHLAASAASRIVSYTFVSYYGKGAINVAFVRPSVRSVHSE